MAQIGVDANGRITIDGKPLDRHDPRLWGSVGRNVTDISTRGSPGSASEYDPRYYYRSGQGTDSEGGGGMNDIYSLRPEYADRLGGRIQLGQAGVGGAGEISQEGLANATYDPEFGVLVDPRYIKAPQDWEYAGPIVMAALGGAAAFGGAGLGNMASEAMGNGTGMFGPGGGLDPETLGGAGGMGGPMPYDVPANLEHFNPSDLSRFSLDGPGGYIPPDVPGLNDLFPGGMPTDGIGVPDGSQLTGSGMFDNVPDWLRNAGGTLGSAISKDPIRAAMLGMSIANGVSGLVGGKPNGNGGGNGGWGPMNPGTLNIGNGSTGNSSGWQPNAITAAQLRRLYGG